MNKDQQAIVFPPELAGKYAIQNGEITEDGVPFMSVHYAMPNERSAPLLETLTLLANHGHRLLLAEETAGGMPSISAEVDLDEIHERPGQMMPLVNLVVHRGDGKEAHFSFRLKLGDRGNLVAIITSLGRAVDDVERYVAAKFIDWQEPLEDEQ